MITKREVHIQGDVMFLKVADLDALPDRDKFDLLSEEPVDLIVALGEVTGHEHVVENVIDIPPSDLAHNLFYKAAAEVLDHQRQEIVGAVLAGASGATVAHVGADGERTGEHNDVNLPPGVYVVAKQRKFDPFTLRGSSWSTVVD